MPCFIYVPIAGLPWWLSSKETACHYRRLKRCRFDPWVRKIPWSRKWQPTPVFLPGKFHGQKSPGGYSPRDHKESNTTEHAPLPLSNRWQTATNWIKFLLALSISLIYFLGFKFVLRQETWFKFVFCITFCNKYNSHNKWFSNESMLKCFVY